jgi:Bax protein
MADNQPSPQSHRPQLVFALLLCLLFAGAGYMPLPSRFFSGPATDPLFDALLERQLPREIPDFASIPEVEVKKQAFFDFLQPFVDLQNARVQLQRERLLSIIGKIEREEDLARGERVFLRSLAMQYQMEGNDYRDPAFLNRLLRRVDILPPSLVLAQAANESAWGTSRFALEVNNFFGQWCYTQGCGVVPSRRGASARHEVKAFASVEEAVQAYFMNLNTFPSYLDLRLMRERLRAQEQPIDGLSLAEGLESYSERGEAYIRELQDIIRGNGLVEKDLALTPLQTPSLMD